tara:strand:- start:1958 stop:3214 length:1257 start_codon:yes stop_codon:yes gene_type:complete
MLSLKYINENINLVKECIKYKKCDININDILSLDLERKSLINKVEKLKANRNQINKQISKNRNDKSEDTTTLISNMKELSVEIKNLDKSLFSINNSLSNKLLYIPNIIHETTPKGSVNDNVVIKEWGKKPEFNFEIKDHKDLCDLNNLVDFKRAANISGSGFPLYTNNGAKLERSLINFMLDIHSKNGYTELFPPFLVNSNSPKTTGNLPKFSDDMYYIDKDDLYCIPTAEVPITNMHLNEILDDSDLPKKYVAYSACFRREAGSYGKDTKGLLRLHQFNKVELVKFVKPKDSYVELESLLKDAESILQKLNLHYRIIALASGDLSFSAAKCYDIEVWSPFEKKYLEVSSCSNFESFQASRGNIKFRNKDTNKLEFLHTLNGSGLATPRLTIAILETFQDKNGKIEIPSILKKYINYE